MIKDRIVRIKLKKYFQHHRPINYIGKVTAYSDDWIILDARMVLLSRNQPNGVQIDKKSSATMLARDSIESIRILPDDFDCTNIIITTEGQQLQIEVKGAGNAFIGEFGEG